MTSSIQNSFLQTTLNFGLEHKKYNLVKKVLLWQQKNPNYVPLKFNTIYLLVNFLNQAIDKNDVQMAKLILNNDKSYPVSHSILNCIRQNKEELTELLLTDAYIKNGKKEKVASFELIASAFHSTDKIFNLVAEFDHSIDSFSFFQNINSHSQERIEKMIDIFLRQELHSEDHFLCILILGGSNNRMSDYFWHHSEISKTLPLYQKYLSDNINITSLSKKLKNTEAHKDELLYKNIKSFNKGNSIIKQSELNKISTKLESLKLNNETENNKIFKLNKL